MRVVKTRKDHHCCYCDKTIEKGNLALYSEERWAKMDVEDVNQIGIIYSKIYWHAETKRDTQPSCDDHKHVIPPNQTN